MKSEVIIGGEGCQADVDNLLDQWGQLGSRGCAFTYRDANGYITHIRVVLFS